MKKKESKRSKSEYPALNPNLNLKTRQDLIDYDYVDKLSDKDKEWLNKFTEEYTNASFKKEIPKKKGKRRKAANLHKSKEHKKSVYDANNARNRDILTRAKAQGAFISIEDVKWDEEEFSDRLKELFGGNQDSSD